SQIVSHSGHNYNNPHLIKTTVNVNHTVTDQNDHRSKWSLPSKLSIHLSILQTIIITIVSHNGHEL
ncbi:hypothetical protein E4U12_002525, partial [Claviceps purpurea]